jgi:hypothetical protein
MTETPQDFDLDAWLDDAERPQRSVTVYQKAGLIADLDALEAKILAAEDDEDVDGPSMGGGPAKLRAEYQKLAKQFHDSALTIRIEGRDENERAKAAAGETDPALRGAAVIADAITSPKFSAKQVEKLAEKIGEAQFANVVATFKAAFSDMPSVSADFLPKRSTPDDGGE